MNISIFGLGYVGCVSLGCLAEFGHKMIGVDINPTKVDLINNAKATIAEKKIDDLIKKGVNSEKIKATLNVNEAINESDLAIICVGTPNEKNGNLNMSNVYTVARQMGKEIKNKKDFFSVAIRSTVMPGTNREVAEIINNESGKEINKDFAVVSNPEFMREGSAVNDFFNPAYTLVASESDKAIRIMRQVYKGINAEFVVTDVGPVELIKFVNNSFHALKVVFGNEIGRICKALCVDSYQVMDLFFKDKVLNLSPYYLKPGFAYGGSCLPKDLKALNNIAHDNYIDSPLLSAIEKSNRQHIEYALNLILERQKRIIGIYGISFKPETDDLRFSPGLELTERLIGKGKEVKVFDKNVNLSILLGKNKDFVYNKLPYIQDILIDNLDKFLEDLELLIIINKDDMISKLKKKDLKNLVIIDLTRVEAFKKFGNYEGICW